MTVIFYLGMQQFKDIGPIVVRQREAGIYKSSAKLWKNIQSGKCLY